MGDFTVNVRQKPMDFNRWQLGLIKKRQLVVEEGDEGLTAAELFYSLAA